MYLGPPVDKVWAINRVDSRETNITIGIRPTFLLTYEPYEMSLYTVCVAISPGVKYSESGG